MNLYKKEQAELKKKELVVKCTEDFAKGNTVRAIRNYCDGNSTSTLDAFKLLRTLSKIKK